jgi:hypothetical protein
MKKFEDYWNGLVAKRPELANPETKTEFLSKNLRKLCEQFYNAGSKNESSKKSVFDSIFGKDLFP